jgi:hypothetical protein
MTSSPLNRLERHWPEPSSEPGAPLIDGGQVAAKAEAVRRRVEQLIGDHPQVTVLTAAAVGVLLGWYIKRK